jgi:hypothetical protein
MDKAVILIGDVAIAEIDMALGLGVVGDDPAGVLDEGDGHGRLRRKGVASLDRLDDW